MFDSNLLHYFFRTRYFSESRQGHTPLHGRAYYQMMECLGVSLSFLVFLILSTSCYILNVADGNNHLIRLIRFALAYYKFRDPFRPFGFDLVLFFFLFIAH